MQDRGFRSILGCKCYYKRIVHTFIYLSSKTISVEELIKPPKQTKLVDRTDQTLIPFPLKSSSCDSLIILKGKHHVTVISITRWLP